MSSQEAYIAFISRIWPHHLNADRGVQGGFSGGHDQLCYPRFLGGVLVALQLIGPCLVSLVSSQEPNGCCRLQTPDCIIMWAGKNKHARKPM